jgi:hypothetical protein
LGQIVAGCAVCAYFSIRFDTVRVVVLGRKLSSDHALSIVESIPIIAAGTGTSTISVAFTERVQSLAILAGSQEVPGVARSANTSIISGLAVGIS